jgi:RHS repeat-associated protein
VNTETSPYVGYDYMDFTQAGGVDTTVQSIAYAYYIGRTYLLTSYPTNDCTGTPLNQVYRTYNDAFGILWGEYQEHEGAKDADSIRVVYSFASTVSGGVYTYGRRLTSVYYPNVGANCLVRPASAVAARLVYSLYTDSGDSSGIGDAISRVTALSNEATRADEDEVYAAYAYNGAGRIVLETQKNASNTVAELDYYQSTTPDTYDGFDRFGRVVDQKWTDGTDPIDRYGYGYDANSNRTYRENSLAADRSEVYAYDMLDRLTEMDRGTLNEQKTAITGTPARQEDWTLNQTGNWAGYDVAEDGSPVLTQTRENNKANEITATTEAQGQTQWVTPEYDARGNMISMPKPDSPASAFTCVWDAWDRLMEVKDKSTGAIVATYRYDGTRRRIAKLLGPDPENPTATYDYYYAVRQVLEIRKDGSEHPYKQYVWGLRYVHSPVCRWYDEDADGEGVVQHYYCNDANFNVTALVNTSGTVVERYTYDPYGKVTFRAADWSPLENNVSAYANDVLFTGHRLDTETGLYYGGWRYYHPTLGLWTSRDPDGYVDGLNTYLAALGNPLCVLDPYGLKGTVWIGDLETEAKVAKECETMKPRFFFYNDCKYTGTYTKVETPWSQLRDGFWIRKGTGTYSYDLYEEEVIRIYRKRRGGNFFGIPTVDETRYADVNRSYARAYYLKCHFDCCNWLFGERAILSSPTRSFYERYGVERVNEQEYGVVYVGPYKPGPIGPPGSEKEPIVEETEPEPDLPAEYPEPFSASPF